MREACSECGDPKELRERVAVIVREELAIKNLPEPFVNAMVLLLQGGIGMSDAMAMGLQGIFTTGRKE